MGNKSSKSNKSAIEHKDILDELDNLQIEPTKLTLVLLGTTGVGKTTLFRYLQTSYSEPFDAVCLSVAKKKMFELEKNENLNREIWMEF